MVPRSHVSTTRDVVRSQHCFLLHAAVASIFGPHDTGNLFGFALRLAHSSHTVYGWLLDVAGTRKWRGQLLVLSVLGVWHFYWAFIFKLLRGFYTTRQGFADDGKVRE